MSSPSNMGTYVAGTTVCVSSGGTIDGEAFNGMIDGRANLTNADLPADANVRFASCR